MRKFILLLIFIPILGFTQTFTWEKREASCPESFSNFLEGVAYAHIWMTEESVKFIQDNPNGANAAMISGLLDYLEAMEFEKVTWGSNKAGNNSGSQCWYVNIAPSWNWNNNYADVKLTFYSCTEEKWEYSLGYLYNSDYSSLKTNTYNAFRDAYGYKKRSFNPDERCNLRSWIGKFDGERITESSLKTYFDRNGTTGIEGIYESIAEKSLHPRYKVGVLEKDDGGYILLYLDGAGNNYDWIEGEWKASLKETATSGFWKINSWVMANKTTTDEYFASYAEGGINIIMRGEETFYLKLYPTGNSTSKNWPSTDGKTGSGTGFAISSNGYIATNYHVIEGANKIKVKGINGDLNQSYSAQVIVSDKNNDLAILKVEKWLGTIPYGMKLDKLGVAEEVFAYGYPLTAILGNEIKFTDGRISSGTGMDNDPRYYQHTASLQPGNSGGPLFNKYGNIVGVNTLTLSKNFDDQSGIDTENIFYSIKTNYLKILMDNLDISTPKNNEIYKYSIPNQYKEIKNFVYTIETY